VRNGEKGAAAETAQAGRPGRIAPDRAMAGYRHGIDRREWDYRSI